jgi:hypothetical protein
LSEAEPHGGDRSWFLRAAGAPGDLFFRGFLLAEQKKVTQGAGAEPPAISFSKSKAVFRRLLVAQGLLLPGMQQNPLHPFGGVNTR